MPVSDQSNGGEIIDRYVDLVLSVFGSISPTEEDRRALAEHLGLEAARWVNDRYGLGLTAR